ncbi:MAG: prolipoprotein diacylglyceryl transferase [Bacillota bacterium]|nr:prolipoprotein diacylglyceryl transferase [Bacillota bacterium]MDI7249680.1 prolipoprotein diacylglyceryl transferase [Bacillota bacterium]
MHPIAFRVAGLEIHTWGVLFALGFGLAILAGEWNARRVGLPSWLYVESSFYIAVAAILGARLLYVALEWGQYSGHPWRVLNTREGGLSLYGGLIGGVLAVWAFTRRRRVPTARFLDGGAPAIALGTAITRVGCFLEGCCWGILTGGDWGFLTRFAPGLRHPAQLYEMVLDLALFAVLWYLAPRLTRLPGQLFLFYVAGYSAIRFAVEFWRDVPHLGGWVTVTQPAALAAVLGSLALAWVRWHRARRSPGAVESHNL